MVSRSLQAASKVSDATDIAVRTIIDLRQIDENKAAIMIVNVSRPQISEIELRLQRTGVVTRKKTP